MTLQEFISQNELDIEVISKEAGHFLLSDVSATVWTFYFTAKNGNSSRYLTPFKYYDTSRGIYNPDACITIEDILLDILMNYQHSKMNGCTFGRYCKAFGIGSGMSLDDTFDLMEKHMGMWLYAEQNLRKCKAFMDNAQVSFEDFTSLY